MNVITELPVSTIFVPAIITNRKTYVLIKNTLEKLF